jgi:hypothetical protein
LLHYTGASKGPTGVNVPVVIQLKNALPNGIIIKNGLLRSLTHNFNPTVAKNFPGYEYAIFKNIGR